MSTIVGGAWSIAIRRTRLRRTAGVSGRRLAGGSGGGFFVRLRRGAAAGSGGGSNAGAARVGRALLGAPISTLAFRLVPLATGPGGGAAGGSSGGCTTTGRGGGSIFGFLAAARAFGTRACGTVGEAFAAAAARARTGLETLGAAGGAFGTGLGGLRVRSRTFATLMVSSGVGGGNGRGGGASPPRQAGRAFAFAGSTLLLRPRRGVSISKYCGVAAGIVGSGSFFGGTRIPPAPPGGGGGSRELPAMTGCGGWKGCRIRGTPLDAAAMAPAPGGGGGGPWFALTMTGRSGSRLSSFTTASCICSAFILCCLANSANCALL